MRRLFNLLIAVSLSLPLSAHAILVKSTPAANSILVCPAEISLTFNSRIDAARSQLVLITPDRERRKLTVTSVKAASDQLAAHLDQLPPGGYKIEWQVLAIDGHITRGVIPFVAAGHA